MPRARTTLIALATLAGLAIGSFPANAAGEDGPTYQMPVVGECHQYSIGATAERSEPSPAVDCAGTHSALVTAVAELPADTDWTEGSADILAAVTENCLPGFQDAVGQSYRVIARSAFAQAYYIPTQEQRDHGASWLRCDVNLQGFRQLLPIGTAPLLPTKKFAEDVQKCLMVRARTGGFEPSSCGTRHNYVVEKVLVVPGGKFPSSNRFLRYAGANCPSAIQGRLWYSTWRSRMDWQAGDHTLVCYRPAS